MKIVVVDGETLNPGDLNWEQLNKFGECEIFSVTPTQDIVERCKDADIVVTNKVAFDRAVLNALPKLKMISVTATGYNVIDTEAAKELNIIVSNVPVYGTQSVAQMVIALLLELCHHVGHHAQTVKEGRWSACSNFCYWDKSLVELDGKIMGIIGCGRIGLTTAKLAQAFGMKTIGYDLYAPSGNCKIEMASLDEVFSQSDIVSVHCPLTSENSGFVNENYLSKMKKTAFVINTSRGALINEQDLANALNNEQIAGAGLDVLSTEPPKSDNPLLKAKNCYITPHIAWATNSARKRLMDTTVENIRAFINGQPVNVVV